MFVVLTNELAVGMIAVLAAVAEKIDLRYTFHLLILRVWPCNTRGRYATLFGWASINCAARGKSASQVGHPCEALSRSNPFVPIFT